MKKKILIVQFRHETNVFAPTKADKQAFENVRFVYGSSFYMLATRWQIRAGLLNLNKCIQNNWNKELYLGNVVLGDCMQKFFLP